MCLFFQSTLPRNYYYELVCLQFYIELLKNSTNCWKERTTTYTRQILTEVLVKVVSIDLYYNL